MSNKLYRFELTEFTFPAGLSDSKANFRMQVDVRYTSGDDVEVDTVILPGVDVYWECSKGRNKKGGENGEGAGMLVRKTGQSSEWPSELDMQKAGPWGTRFRLSADELHELRVVVFDVNRQDWVEKMTGFVKEAFSVLSGAVPKKLKPFVDEAATSVGKRMARGDDKILVTMSATRDDDNRWVMSRNGFTVKLSSSDASEQ